MINHAATGTFVAERQASMLSEAEHRRLARGSSSRRAIRPVARARSRWVVARSASSTRHDALAPIGAGGIRSLLHLSRS